ncbi:hypothetical protein A1D18_05520 [Candidatus Rickettsiella isopodorum]|jgi:hypothetical protein|uniref:Uncharacterized protein n=1 Tax=Candidatus Rickettsiella isopodorum TaxID=1225476 RepID=A0A1J8NJS0_9COXI|nr:hypothetical protein [Candidatus Rickettsiella isopodorum]MCH9636905.1 hypothetical protein [Gammaproteobacteria bacterium]MDQ5900033.1 hypothetical protein [Pseudomonadota bacterium]MCH9754400.1 hypothetical protein [Gammaproteobacteria bacterium]MDD4893171.1 hypothetical protein [Candidatus Rickettsiella isopodorum]MDD5161570.1 hypothetical protein [Candidatus Rickettsiella isopodorum]
MKEYHYTPISTESTRSTFFDYINNVNLPPIDYFSVGIEDYGQKKITSLISRLEWQIYFDKNQITNNDPLIKAKKLSQRKIIPFSEIDYIDSFGKEVMRQRSLHGMKNGLMLIHKQHHINYMIVLATGVSKFNHFSFLTKYYTQLIRLKNDLSKIIEREINYILN